MTRVFVFTNHKGGVGKSTSATNTALGIEVGFRTNKFIWLAACKSFGYIAGCEWT
ncbi:MAG: hypothetical protein R3E39_25770 [Anaerolineae bacterium]